jgi:RNA polymerase sigma-70 factor (ECF subfamily)
VARCADGDETALATLYDQSNRLVYSLILAIVRNTADAEEVTLDVYTQVWTSASRYDGARGNVGAWLITLARSRAIDRIRARRRREKEQASDAEVFSLPFSGLSPEAGAEAAERQSRVMAAIECLTAGERELVMLAFFHGLTHGELASRVQRPLGTVKTRLRIAMVKLRERLREPTGRSRKIRDALEQAAP